MTGAAEKFDAIIVGARCAGAPLATHLARSGMRIALLDAARLPSDQPTSTHLIHHAGMVLLDELGVGDGVRRLAPAIHAYRFGCEHHGARCTAGARHAARCLRRSQLDVLLQNSACAAGAELRTSCRVTGLIGDDRVGGVEVQRAGRTERLLARIVVGADGRRSTVARLVAAREYLGYDGPRAAYWAYWPRPSAWSASELFQGIDGEDLRFVFPTDGDLLLVGTAPLLARARAWRSDHAAAYLHDVRSDRVIGPMLRESAPVGDVRGVVGLRYFFRAAAGPGWALVGDAAHHKDFVIGRGISDALRDAKALAQAIVDGGEAALARYWYGRDLASIASFRLGEDLGGGDAVTDLERAVFAHLAAAPHLADRLLDLAIRPDPSYATLPFVHVVLWACGALLQGRPAAVTQLVNGIRRTLQVRRERTRCRRLLATVGARHDWKGAAWQMPM